MHRLSLLLQNLWFYRITFVVALVFAMFWATKPFSVTPALFPYQDKVSHALAFFVLTLLLDLSCWLKKRRHQFSLLVIYGLLIEGVQYFLPYRSTEMADFLADAAGILLFFALRGYFHRLSPMHNRL